MSVCDICGKRIIACNGFYNCSGFLFCSVECLQKDKTSLWYGGWKIQSKSDEQSRNIWTTATSNNENEDICRRIEEAVEHDEKVERERKSYEAWVNANKRKSPPKAGNAQ